VDLLRREGQAVITTTELDHVPGGEEPDVTHIEIIDGGDVSPRRLASLEAVAQRAPASRLRSDAA
jgi:hypothetical protein